MHYKSGIYELYLSVMGVGVCGVTTDKNIRNYLWRAILSNKMTAFISQKVR